MQLCKLRAELINWHVCTASRAKQLSFSGASLYCVKKTPSFLRAGSAIPSKTLYYTAETCLVSLREAGSKTTCLATPVAFYRSSLALLDFPRHSAEELRSLTYYHQFVFPVSQHLALAKWTLLWSTVLVYLIQKLPKRILQLLFSEDKVHAKIFTYLTVIVASL